MSVLMFAAICSLMPFNFGPFTKVIYQMASFSDVFTHEYALNFGSDVGIAWKGRTTRFTSDFIKYLQWASTFFTAQLAPAQARRDLVKSHFKRK